MSAIPVTSITTALQFAMQQLTTLPESARIDAEALLCHAIGNNRSYLHTWPEKPLTTPQWRLFQRLIERRQQGEPVAYLTGQREFWSLPIKVTPDTLIPRPETETLIECALALIAIHKTVHIADLGTGSGAIALALAHERPQAQLLAVDSSAAALSITAENIAAIGLNSIRLCHSHWLNDYRDQPFDLIVANPPYIRSDDPHLEQGDLPYEPRSALIAGPSGLEDIELIIKQSRQHLTPHGWLLLEHGFDQQAAVIELMQQHGYQTISGHKDLAGQARVVQGQQP